MLQNRRIWAGLAIGGVLAAVIAFVWNRGSHEGEANAAEITTDFIPLIQGGRLVQSDGGHLVRVELPRSALVSFGLPVNFERAGGRVKADVLLGDDGIARAIRFVR